MPSVYGKYMRSLKWQKFKRRLKRDRGTTCERCHATGVAVEVHHKTYERLGCELPEDVEILCRECHRADHHA